MGVNNQNARTLPAGRRDEHLDWNVFHQFSQSPNTNRVERGRNTLIAALDPVATNTLHGLKVHGFLKRGCHPTRYNREGPPHLAGRERLIEPSGQIWLLESNPQRIAQGARLPRSFGRHIGRPIVKAVR